MNRRYWIDDVVLCRMCSAKHMKRRYLVLDSFLYTLKTNWFRMLFSYVVVFVMWFACWYFGLFDYMKVKDENYKQSFPISSLVYSLLWSTLINLVFLIKYYYENKKYIEDKYFLDDTFDVFSSS